MMPVNAPNKFKSRAYGSWRSMKQRCLNRNDKEFYRYGGRGIQICSEWIDSFDSFLSDMGNPNTDKHTIERIDNNGDYCPENCRWATQFEQKRNWSRNVNLTLNGTTKCAQDWSQLLGINNHTIVRRIKWGWPAEAVLLIPPKMAQQAHNTLKKFGGINP